MAIAGAFVVPHPPIIFPEIGHGEQRKIQKTIDAYREAAKQIAQIQPDTLIIVSPHCVMYRDYFHLSSGRSAAGDFGKFGCPQVRLTAEYDEELTEEIERAAFEEGIPAGREGEQDGALDHGTMIPLRFVQEAYHKPFRIVRIGLSGLSLAEHFHLGKCIYRAVERTDRRAVLMASGDLSHRLLDSGPYEYAMEGPEYDRRITGILAEGLLDNTLDFSEAFCERAGECGHRSITVMAGCMEGIPLSAQLMSYEGPFGVGYAVAAFMDAYVALARQSLDCCVKTHEMLQRPKKLPKEMTEKKAGVFVSLKKAGNLRGCIGTIRAVRECVADEVIENAVSAGLWDPRFPQVEEEELKDIVCTVDVLSEAEPVSSLSELDVKRYGVIVSCGEKRGLLLPNLKGVETVEEQLAIAARKAGIEEEEYTEGRCLLERFEVVRHA